MKPSTVLPGNKRRNFLKQLLAGTAATLAYPAVGSIKAETSRTPLPSLLDAADERYWEMVKKQFTVPSDLMMLNAANLCPSPYFISEHVQTLLRDLGKDVSFQFRHQFSEKRQKSLDMLAKYVGVSKEEIGITRNTTESNNIIVNGFDFKAGDEILLWDQNHYSNGIAWEQRAKRFGFTVKKVSVPQAPKSPEELMTPFVTAITPKTKLIAFSHISNLSGIALPAKELCRLAREKKILTLVDGAQSFGLIDLDLKDMGCDFFSGSTHKWLMGPLENGILYVKKESMERLWPNIISAGWKETSLTVDEKLCVLGQRNDTTPAALPETVDFHLSIGKRNIEDRVRKLNSYLKDQLQVKFPQAVFVSPLSPTMSAGIVVVNIPGKQSPELFQKLYDAHGIACASTSGVRLSPHIYNTMEDMNKVVSALGQLAG